MKKIIMFVMVLAIGLTAGIANAALLASESFEYTAGTPLQNQNGGTGWAGPWEEYDDNSGTASIQAGSLVHPTIYFPNTPGGHVRTGISAEAMFDRTIVASILDEAGEQAWISYLFTVETDPTVNNWRSLDLFSGDEFIAGAGQPWSTDSFGLLASDMATGYESDPEIEITVGQVYWIVVKIEFSGDSNPDNIYLWVDPEPSTEPSTATAAVEITDGESFANDGLNLIMIVAQGQGRYDEIKLATTFDHIGPGMKNPIIIDPNVMTVYEEGETEGDFTVALKRPPVGQGSPGNPDGTPISVEIIVDPNGYLTQEDELRGGGGSADITLLDGSGPNNRVTFTKNAGNWDVPEVIRFKAKEDSLAEPPTLDEAQNIAVWAVPTPYEPNLARPVAQEMVRTIVMDNDQANILFTFTPPEESAPKNPVTGPVKIWEEPRWMIIGENKYPFTRWRKIGVTLQVPPLIDGDPCQPTSVKLQAEIESDNLPGMDPCLPFPPTAEPNGLIFTADDYDVTQSIKIWGNDDEQLQASGLEGAPEAEGDQNYQATLTVTVVDGGGDTRYQWLEPEDPEDPCNTNTILVSLERTVDIDIEDNECGAFGYLAMDVGNSDPCAIDEDGNPLPDCYVDIYDAIEVARRWLDCSDISDPACESYL